MTELALDTQLSSEQRDCLKLVHSSALGLLTIINDILDFSKIEAGKLEIEHIGMSPSFLLLKSKVFCFVRLSSFV